MAKEYKLTVEDLARREAETGYTFTDQMNADPPSLSETKKTLQPGEHRILTGMKNKYNNNRVVFHCQKRGILVFDSTGEWHRYMQLSALEAAGAVTNLRPQVPFELQPAFTTKKGESVRAIAYRADFCYTENGIDIIEDYKGVRTKEFDLKWKMLQYQYGNFYELRLIKK